jgi:histone acetyltransferase (RNA polymerase elongator complex component)
MIVPVFLPHLGCGERCIYCNQITITDLRRSTIKAAIEASLGPIQGITEIGLFGGNIFGLDPSDLTRLFDLFDPYKEKITGFRISTKPVPLKEEIIEILKERGVGIIELGIPSFNDIILHFINRHHTAEDLRTAFYRLTSEGFQVALQVMVGLPGETMKDIQEIVQNLFHLAPHYLRIYPLVVLKETPLADMYREGRFTPLDFEEALNRALFIYLNAVRHNIPVVKMGLTENEIIKEQVIAGHYHPAFGYMVKAWAFYLALSARIRDASIEKGAVSVTLNNRDVPHLIGYKRSNIARFEAAGVSIAWEKGEVEEGSFLITHGNQTTTGTIFDSLAMIPLQ